MKIRNLAIVFCFLCFGLHDLQASNEVGLYFSPSDNCDCIEGGLFSPLIAYLTITNPDVNEIAGWEGTIESSTGIFLSIEHVYGSSTNIGQFPEMIVGLAEPLPTSSTTVLARFSVVATAQGGIWFGPLSRPSIPGSGLPCLLETDGSLRPLNPVHGIGSPQAIIGYGDCSGRISCSSVGGASSVVDVGASSVEYSDPTTSRAFPHGSSTGQLGYRDGPTISSVAGVSDFEIGADGNIYILDSINERIVILDSSLEWQETIDTRGFYSSFEISSFGIVLQDHRTPKAICQRTREGWTVEKISHDDKSLVAIRMGEDSADELSITGSKLSQTEFSINIELANQDPSKSHFPLYRWDVLTGRPTANIGLTINRLVGDNIFLNLDFLESGNKVTPEIAAVDADGIIHKRIKKLSVSECKYRLGRSTRVGSDGSVYMLRVFEEYTEVTKWD